MLTELADVLQRPKFASRLKRLGYEPSELVSIIAEKAKLFENLNILSIVKKDPDDDNVIACALAAKARYIVTGDDHLLSLARYKDIRILPPLAALKLLGN